MDSDRLPITAVILTRDEAIHIGRALDSIAFCERVLIVDSGSRDGTIEIAQSRGADIRHRKWLNYSDQFQWALDHGGITTDWTLRLDADEVIEPDLVAAIRSSLPGLPADVIGINFNRKHIFMGRWVRHGGRFPLTLLRLWRTGHGRIEARWMDEHIVVDAGRTITIKGGFADVNLNDARFFTEKHNSYATREAIDVLARKYGLLADDRSLDAKSNALQARIKRFGKEAVYNRLPFGLGPLLYFLWRFIFQLGFLDGREGRIYHVLQGFWYRFLVDVRKLEFETAMAGETTREGRLARLSEASGYDLSGQAAEADRISRTPTGSQGLPE